MIQMYAHRQIRQILSLSSKQHNPVIIIISVCIIFLLLTYVRQGKLRQISSEDNKKEDVFVINTIEEAFEDAGDVSDDEKYILKRQFRAADFDNNKLLSESEMTMAISRETKQHILQGMRNNFRVFFSLDKITKNGQVDWDEYFNHFVRDVLGLDEATIHQLQHKPNSLNRDIKESVSRLKAAWSEAAHTNPDAVNIDEFLGLEHPESSHSFLTRRLDELMGKFDGDNDGKLTRQEYLLDPYKDLSAKDLRARGKEFDEVLDKNHNSVADKKEILQFLDPKSQHWAKDEATTLLAQADKNKDMMVSMEEMFARADIFLMSKLVSAELSFHGEF